MGAAASIFDPVEAVKEPWKFLLRNPDASVLNSQFDMVIRRRQGDCNLAFEGKLEGVGDQIEDNLLPHVAIDKYRLRQLRAIQFEYQSGLFRRRPEYARQFDGNAARSVG